MKTTDILLIILLVILVLPTVARALFMLIVIIFEYRLNHSKYRDGRKRPKSRFNNKIKAIVIWFVIGFVISITICWLVGINPALSLIYAMLFVLGISVSELISKVN